MMDRTKTLDRDRLAKLLGMVGSDHDGESVSAARHADRLVRQSGMSWREIVADNSPHHPLRAPVEQTDGDDLDDEIDFCLRNLDRLNDWERRFLISLRDQRSPLSIKQKNKVAAIVDKLLRVRAEAAA